MKRCMWTLAVTPALFLATAHATPTTDAGRLEVAQAVHQDTLPSLRNVVIDPAGYDHWRQHAEHRIPLPYMPPGQTDGALQNFEQAIGQFAPTFIGGVDGVGQGFSGPNGSFTVQYAPPDTDRRRRRHAIRAGRQRRLRGLQQGHQSVVYGPVPTSTLWSGFGGECQTNNDGDPIVVYDKAANRWIITQFSVSTTPYLQCVAVSQTSDATGGWYRYSFSYGSVFPGLSETGVWPDAYYITFNMFTGQPSRGSKLVRLQPQRNAGRRRGHTAVLPVGSSFGGVLPSDLDGSTAPPAGSPNFMVNFGTNSLNLWKFHVDWTTPANTSAHRSDQHLRSQPSARPAAAANCIPQPGTNQKLDSLADRLMYRLAYRNFGRS